MMEQARIITVGLSSDACAVLQRWLGSTEIQPVEGSAQLADALSEARPSLVIVNHSLGGTVGVDVVNQAWQAFPGLPVIYILDRRLDSDVGRKLLEQMGLDAPLLSPIDPADVAKRIAHMLDIPLTTPAVASVKRPGDPSVGEPTSAVEPAPSSVEPLEDAEAEVATTPAVPEREGEDDVVAHAGRPFLLLVDDTGDVSERIVAEAAARGMRAVATASVAEARTILAQDRPDAVLLDLGLIDSNDDSLTLLEDLDRSTFSVPVLFLAERDSFIERVQAVSLGGRAFLTKSMPPSDIVKAVWRLLQQLQATESRVLAVDDDPGVLADLRNLLEPKGIKLTTLQDPLRFWNTLEQSVPDLLMVDFDLPRWSGLELCRVVRTDTRWSALPVLCLTADADSDTVQRVFDAGADDFVSKPIVGPELVTKVVNRLQRIQLYRIMAEIDPLTGIANRLKATETLDRLLRLAKRQGQAFSLAILDLDNFKQINDRFGHGTGDDALLRLGALLTRTFRTEDFVARFGGEEFVVGMYGMPRSGGVQRLTDLLEALRDETPARMRDAGVLLTYSAGVAQYPHDGSQVEELRAKADAALYHAKRDGKNRVVAADPLAEERGGGLAVSVDVVLISTGADGDAMVGALVEDGWSVQWIKEGESAVLRLAGVEPQLAAHVVLLDLGASPPGGRLDSLTVLRRLERDGVVGRTRVIVIDGPGSDGSVRKAMDMGAFGQISRPVNLVALQQLVRQAMEVP
jgi:diguanylate cyclase (GGDEF)-like protein